LGLGVEEYKLYGDFKRYILQPAKREIPKKTDICFEFKEKKQGRKVRFIIFQILSNRTLRSLENEEMLKLPFRSENKLKEPEQHTQDHELYNKLQTYFLLSKTQAQKVIKEYDKSYILENLKVVEERYKKGNIDKSKIGPYTLKAFKEDFRIKKSVFDIEKEKQEEIAQQKKLKKRKERNYQMN